MIYFLLVVYASFMTLLVAGAFVNYKREKKEQDFKFKVVLNDKDFVKEYMYVGTFEVSVNNCIFIYTEGRLIATHTIENRKYDVIPM